MTLAVPANWPGADRRRPALSSSIYAVRAPLARWLEGEALDARQRFGPYSVLDVGCGEKPYLPLFAPYVRAYVGVDVVATPYADLQGPVEELPVPDGSYDVVLCNQVLEHCADPGLAVAELFRVTRPGGRVLASTHGVQMYHPAPDDLWRWTHTGLERLFGEHAAWSAVTVRPGAGTTACLGMLISGYVDLLAGRARVGSAGRMLVAGVNRAARAIDGRSEKLREPGPGTLFANYHVAADR